MKNQTEIEEFRKSLLYRANNILNTYSGHDCDEEAMKRVIKQGFSECLNALVVAEQDPKFKARLWQIQEEIARIGK